MEDASIVLAEPDRLLQDGCAHARGGCNDEAQGEGPADASAENVTTLDREVIEQRHLIGGVRGPTVRSGHGRARLPRVALIHGDYTELPGELAYGMKRSSVPERDARPHPAGRQEKDGVAAPVDLVVNRRLANRESRHEGDLSHASVTRRNAGQVSMLPARPRNSP
jgi:hypothetical protein